MLQHNTAQGYLVLSLMQDQIDGLQSHEPVPSLSKDIETVTLTIPSCQIVPHTLLFLLTD
jgi:hypothetical protein